MHILFNAAMRWELVPYQYNLMSLVRVKDSSKTLREPRFLTVQEFRALLEHIPEPFRASHEWMPLDRSLADKLRQRTGDPLCAMRSVRSTVRSMERTNAEWHRRLRGREDQSMNTHIYTPRLKNTGERLRLKLNDADWVVVNRNRGTLRVKGIVTDQKTGKRYRIKGAACGLQCCCDATAEEV